jgi:hypothetical protein
MEEDWRASRRPKQEERKVVSMKKPRKGITAFGSILLGTALLLCALLFAPAAIANASPNQLQSMLVKGPTVAFSPGTTISSTATCPEQGQVVTGGTADDSETGGTPPLNFIQSLPAQNSWQVTIVSGGETGAETAVAVCTSPQLQTKLVKGPVTKLVPGSTVSSAAQCPDGQLVTGGTYDNEVTGGAFPFNVTQTQSSPGSWTVSVSGNFTGTVTAVAICAKAPDHQHLQTAFALGPTVALSPGQTVSSMAKCPDGLVVTGGTADLTSTGGTFPFNFTTSMPSQTKWQITVSSNETGSLTAVAVCSSLS